MKKINKRLIFTILFLVIYITILIVLPAGDGWDYMPTDSRLF
jgi:hypothetical protein